MGFHFSDRSQELQLRIIKFLDDHIYPAEEIYAQQMQEFTEQGDRWQIPQIIEDKKEIAKEEGLWNLFLPENPMGESMSNLDYAPLAELMGRSGIASEIFNCSAPDTGNMEVLARYANEEQQERWLKPLLDGEIRSAFAMTEPAVASSDATNICTTAVLEGDEYVINGQKIWTSRAEHSDLMLLLARTSPRREGMKKTHGLSVILVDMRKAVGNGLTIRPIRTMMNHATTEVFFDNLRVPAENLIGEEGKGFKYILTGMNAERILIAAECVGDAKWFTQKSVTYAKDRRVFDRAIGQNQGVQFPIAKAYTNMRAAELMVKEALRLYEAGENPGAEANMAKMLAADASFEAANACVQTHGGFGFAEEYDIERKFRETRLYQVAPISTNLILSYLSEHVLGLPRSY